MKSLLDIQQDIRELEKNVANITDTVKEIDSNLEELRSDGQEKSIDWFKISILAKNIKFKNHPIKKIKDSLIQKAYIKLLLNIVMFDSDIELSLSRLIFIQWIKTESKIGLALEDLYKDCYKMKPETYYEIADSIPEEYRENLIVDTLIVAHLGGTANAEIYKYIADIVAIFGIEKERLITLSFVSKVSLRQDTNWMKREDKGRLIRKSKKYGHYISEELIRSTIISIRKIIFEIPERYAYRFSWDIASLGRRKKEGDILASYEDSRENYAKKKIPVTIDGYYVTWFCEDNIYYAVSYYDEEGKFYPDDLDSIKAWAKEQKKGGKS